MTKEIYLRATQSARRTRPASRPRQRPKVDKVNRQDEIAVNVNNLPLFVDWQQLKDTFAEFSPRFADVKMDPRREKRVGVGVSEI